MITCATDYLLCNFCFAGSVVGYEARREAPYNIGANDPYAVDVNPNYLQEQSQRLFWGNQGSNQVGGTGLWAHLTNKFPILGNMFGRMELPAQYGVPSQNDLSTQYGLPSRFQQQNYEQPQFYQQPQIFQQRQVYHQPQTYQQPFNQQQFGQRLVPSARDVGLTDDAVIVTPPFVPVNQPVAPSPVPIPVPAPLPIPQPVPNPEPSLGYNYEKPRFRLELPLK